MLVLIVVSTFSIFQMQAQTFGSGNLGGTGCTPTGTLGGCTNTYIGSAAGTAVTANNAYNTFIGSAAGTSTNGSSAYNTFVGANSGSLNTSGINNSFFGYGSGYSNVSGNNNVFLGHLTGCYNTSSNNTFIGSCAGLNNATGTGNTFVGFAAGFYNTTGKSNSALGDSALALNTTGIYNTASGLCALFSNTTGSYNTATGTGALFSNTTANSNTAFGLQSLYNNTTGYQNTAQGNQSLYSNTTGYKNTANGNQALYNNTTANGNTALGFQALYSNTTGGTGASTGANVAVGYKALYGNTEGISNCATGERTLLANTTGNYNTAFGSNAGTANATCNYSTFIGYGADANGNYTNATAIGNGALALGNNTIYLGNGTITAVVSAVGSWSDGRFKFNINDSVKGLDFINKLRPVTYQMNTKALDDFIIQNMPDSVKTMHQIGMDFVPSTDIIHSGFIAQQVDSAAQACGFISSIVHTPANGMDVYTLNYAEIVVPLVKAVQELSNKVDSLIALTNVPGGVKSMNNTGNNDSENNMQNIKLSLPEAAILGNAQPNPNNGGTQISYFLPNDISDGKIVFFDILGKVIKEIIIQSGYGLLNIDMQDLPNGIYNYSLIVNGNIIDSKKIIRSK